MGERIQQTLYANIKLIVSDLRPPTSDLLLPASFFLRLGHAKPVAAAIVHYAFNAIKLFFGF